MASDAQRHDVHGVICGHIHQPVMRDIEGVHYINLGDWVDSCSALVEHHDGRFELLHWSTIESAKHTEAMDAQALKAVA